MTGPASLKVYGASIAYNGGKVDAINQTSPIKIHYAPEAMCENKKPSITILSPNGGGIVNILKPFIVSFRTNIV